MAETTLITAMSALPRTSKWERTVNEVSNITFSNIEAGVGEEETVKGQYAKTRRKEQNLARWYKKEEGEEKIRTEMRNSKEILTKIAEAGEFATPGNEIKLEIRPSSTQELWDAKEGKGKFEMYIRTPTVIILEQRQGCGSEEEWDSARFTVYDAPKIEIYVGKGELE